MSHYLLTDPDIRAVLADHAVVCRALFRKAAVQYRWTDSCLARLLNPSQITDYRFFRGKGFDHAEAVRLARADR